MSDVSNAPPAPASAPSSPAPANEVVINPSPVSAPQPVGSQAPEKPPGEVPGSKHRPPTRRESIQKAFDRANDDTAKPKAPAPARPKVAASRTADDQSAGSEGQKDQGKLDLRKPVAGERYREGGRFARVPDAASPQSAQPQPGQQPQLDKPATPLPETAPYREPPGRWADHAKAEWSNAPESVRGEVYRMSKEFDGAYQKLRGDHDVMNTIRQYHDMATQHGTTLDKALNNYVSMEQKLRSDPFGGFDVITNNLNIMIPDGRGGQRKANFADVAYSYLNRSPDQHKMTQTQNATQAAQHQIGSLHQEVVDLKNEVHQLHNGLRFNATRSQVDEFADAHPGFDELGDLIKQELDFGFSLEEAYQRAVKLRPPTHAAQTRNPPAQTRFDKSISGAPEAGPSDGQQPRRKGEKTPARREAIQRAIQRVGARV